MVVFGFSTDDNLVVKDFMKGLNNQLLDPSLASNPFVGDSKIIPRINDLLVVTNIDVKIPTVHPFGYLLLGTMIFFLKEWWNWWYLAPIIMILTHPLVNGRFIYFVIKRKLKQKGVNNIKWISKSEVTKSLYEQYKA